MFYYTGDAPGLDSFLAHSSAIDLLAPQCYWIDKEGFVHGELPPLPKPATGANHPALMPLVCNQGFDRETVTALLHNPQAQARAIRYVAYLARRDNVAGFQVDLENIDPSDHQLFTQFVQQLAACLHRQGRLLSVAVVPRFSSGRPAKEPGRGYTGEWADAFDYRPLGAAADFLTLMAYDDSTRAGPAGPIAGYPWVNQALGYALERVPKEKLLLGIPLYGREWVVQNEATTSRSLTSKDIRALLERPEIRAEWNEKWRSPWFDYVEGGIQHAVWYEDARSWREKFKLMKEYHLKGYAAWRLGYEGPEFWAVAKMETSRPANKMVSARSRRQNLSARARSWHGTRKDRSVSSSH